MRGKVKKECRTRGIKGITPACAGKRVIAPCFWDESEDHPRVCGEKNDGCIKCWQLWGSPPRVRGKVVKQYFKKGQERITPACAGKRRHVNEFLKQIWDHPRVCGEK